MQDQTQWAVVPKERRNGRTRTWAIRSPKGEAYGAYRKRSDALHRAELLNIVSGAVR